MKLASNSLSVRAGIFEIENETDDFEERLLGKGIFRVGQCAHVCVCMLMRF